MSQTKEQKTPGNGPNETEMSNLPDKEFQVMVINMLTEVRKRIKDLRENFNKEIKNIKKSHSELKKT